MIILVWRHVLRNVHAAANGWPEELIFPSGMLHPTPATLVSLVGLPGIAGGKYTVAARGNATVVIVPVVSVAKLPVASVASEAFVFKVTGAEIARD
jgi:hypothetical protein